MVMTTLILMMIARVFTAPAAQWSAWVAGLGEFASFTARAFGSVRRTRALGGRLVRAIYDEGVRCMPVVIIVGIFTGLVLGLQGYYALSRFGSEGMLGNFVAITLTRELAPVVAALLIIGQAGSALAAELGNQRGNEQIDALTTMGVDPIGYLVTPRILASLGVFPILATFLVFAGLAGGLVSGCGLLRLDPGIYQASATSAIHAPDVSECLLKAMVFGVIAITLCCHSGFYSNRRHVSGARAVSEATTRGVVMASIGIIAADYILSSFFV